MGSCSIGNKRRCGEELNCIKVYVYILKNHLIAHGMHLFTFGELHKLKDCQLIIPLFGEGVGRSMNINFHHKIIVRTAILNNLCDFHW